MGWTLPLQNTAYIAGEAVPLNFSNASAIRFFHAQGDHVSLAPSTSQGIPVRLSLGNGSVTYDAVPLPAAAARGFRPGESIYLFWNATGTWIAGDMDGMQGNIGFSPGTWTLSLIDTTSQVLIGQYDLVLTGMRDESPPFPRHPGFIV